MRWRVFLSNALSLSFSLVMRALIIFAGLGLSNSFSGIFDNILAYGLGMIKSIQSLVSWLPNR